LSEDQIGYKIAIDLGQLGFKPMIVSICLF